MDFNSFSNKLNIYDHINEIDDLIYNLNENLELDVDVEYKKINTSLVIIYDLFGSDIIYQFNLIDIDDRYKFSYKIRHKERFFELMSSKEVSGFKLYIHYNLKLTRKDFLEKFDYINNYINYLKRLGYTFTLIDQIYSNLEELKEVSKSRWRDYTPVDITFTIEYNLDLYLAKSLINLKI